MRRGLPVAIRYYRSLSNRRAAGYLVATFLVFASVGFIGDMMHAPAQRPWDGTAVLATAALTGAVGVLFALSPLRSWWFLPVAIVAMVLGTRGIDLMWQARAAGWATAPADFDAIQHRLTLDGRSATVSLLVGFVLFVRFIRTEGIRQTRMRTEMDLAHDIHASLVPPVALTTPVCEVLGVSAPSTEVGGDLVDAHEQEGRLVACVADVAGHGVPAGAVMAMIKSAVRLAWPTRSGLEILLADLNRLLAGLRRPDRFATLACLRFDGSGAAEYALAGHLPILRVGAGTRGVERLENTCLPLGVQADARFTAGRVAAAAGDLFVIFTDGLIEVRDATQRELGIERLESVLREHALGPLADIQRLIFSAAERHGPQLDDQTLLLVRVR